MIKFRTCAILALPLVACKFNLLDDSSPKEIIEEPPTEDSTQITITNPNNGNDSTTNNILNIHLKGDAYYKYLAKNFDASRNTFECEYEVELVQENEANDSISSYEFRIHQQCYDHFNTIETSSFDTTFKIASNGKGNYSYPDKRGDFVSAFLKYNFIDTDKYPEIDTVSRIFLGDAKRVFSDTTFSLWNIDYRVYMESVGLIYQRIYNSNGLGPSAYRFFSDVYLVEHNNNSVIIDSLHPLIR